MRLSLLVAAVSAAAPFAAGIAATPATAASPTVVSANWAGYAAQGGGARFRRVASSWRVPTGVCQRGSRTFSAAWVGLGGYSESSRSLEQTGTEFDCSSSGRPRYSAWYELVPSAARTLKMRIRPGDRITAAVAVQGRRVTLTMRNRSSGAHFRKLSRMAAPDVTSAEWIVEAPSGCTQSGRCRQLPLSAFGDIPFAGANLTNAAGHMGTIADPAWPVVRLQLSQAGAGGTGGPGSGAGASPSDLFSGGSAFDVTYQSQASAGAKRTRAFAPLAR